jgi:hypothetical protein
MIRWAREVIGNWRVAYYEISNWFYVKRIISDHQRTADWSKHNLRADWVGRIYTVLNPQSPTDDGDTLEILRIKYAERLKPINLYLDSIGLSQSVTAAYELIPESKSFLIVYSPIFKVITTWRVFVFTAVVGVFFWSKLDTLILDNLLKGCEFSWPYVRDFIKQIF